MTKKQKLELRAGTIRGRLAELAGTDELTDELPVRNGFAPDRVRRHREADRRALDRRRRADPDRDRRG